MIENVAAGALRVLVMMTRMTGRPLLLPLLLGDGHA